MRGLSRRARGRVAHQGAVNGHWQPWDLIAPTGNKQQKDKTLPRVGTLRAYLGYTRCGQGSPKFAQVKSSGPLRASAVASPESFSLVIDDLIRSDFVSSASLARWINGKVNQHPCLP